MNSPKKDRTRQILDSAEIDAEGWSCRAGLGKSEAEMLLDWLEANGYSQREVLHVEDRGFTIRWRK